MKCQNLGDFTAAQTEFVSEMQTDYARFMDGCLKDALIEQDELLEEIEDDPATGQREAA